VWSTLDDDVDVTELLQAFINEASERNGVFYIGAMEPPTPKEGDIWFQDGFIPGKPLYAADLSKLWQEVNDVSKEVEWFNYKPVPILPRVRANGKTHIWGGILPPRYEDEKDESVIMPKDSTVGSIDETEREIREIDELEQLEGDLFRMRDEIEVIWIEIGKTAAAIVDKKLYLHRKDKDGNYFRTAKAYFQDLDARFAERGQNISYTSINRFVGDYRLFIEGKSGVSLTPAQAVLVGKSNLQAMAPAVRQLQKEGRAEEATQLVTEVVEAAIASGGVPTSEVREAVAEVTGGVQKGLSVEFGKGIFGQKVTKVNLWWGGRSINLLKEEVTDEQAEWLGRRLGIKPGNLL
jgi:hypothetical protein